MQEKHFIYEKRSKMEKNYKLKMYIDWESFSAMYTTHKAASNSFKRYEKSHWARFNWIVNLKEEEYPEY